LHDELAGDRRGEPAEVLGRVVELLGERRTRLVAVGGTLEALARPHRDVPRLAVELDARMGLRTGRLVVRRQQCDLDRVDDYVEADALLALQHPQGGDVDVHQTSFRFSSICTTALTISS